MKIIDKVTLEERSINEAKARASGGFWIIDDNDAILNTDKTLWVEGTDLFTPRLQSEVEIAEKALIELIAAKQAKAAEVTNKLADECDKILTDAGINQKLINAHFFLQTQDTETGIIPLVLQTQLRAKILENKTMALSLYLAIDNAVTIEQVIAIVI